MPKGDPLQPFSARFPEDLVAAYTEHARARGMTRNALLLEALRGYLVMLDAGYRTVRFPAGVLGPQVGDEG